MTAVFQPGLYPGDSDRSPAYWFAFSGKQLLIHTSNQTTGTYRDHPNPIPYFQHWAAIGLEPIRTQFLGHLNDHPCYAAELPSPVDPPTGMALQGFRELYSNLPPILADISGLAFQVMEWDRTHQFCGHCGSPTTAHGQERAKHCPNCGLTQYPRISPAMIVLISRGDEILLGRAHRFRPDMYSLIAGYVEPGESLETCVIREVKEEVGVEIANIRYWGSQPWPFPHTLMVGFTATYAGGEITLDPDELTDAAWFHKHQLPLLPSSISIARKMIDWFVHQNPKA